MDTTAIINQAVRDAGASVSINIRVSKLEKKLLADAAKAEGKSLSAMLRQCALAEVLGRSPKSSGRCVTMTEWRFSLFDLVEKYTGEYTAKGIVVARFTTMSNAERYVVEHKAEGGGSFCHIYGPNNLRRVHEQLTAGGTK